MSRVCACVCVCVTLCVRVCWRRVLGLRGYLATLAPLATCGRVRWWKVVPCHFLAARTAGT